MSGLNLTHYQVLGIQQDASREDIRLAYLRLCKRYHPDHQPKVEADDWVDPWAKIVHHIVREAHDTLIDIDRRDAYDTMLYNARHEQYVEVEVTSSTVNPRAVPVPHSVLDEMLDPLINSAIEEIGSAVEKGIDAAKSSIGKSIRDMAREAFTKKKKKKR